MRSTTESRQQPRSAFGFPWTASAVLLMAFLLRTVGLARLNVWGDQAYSLYVAHQDLWTITVDRTSDGHPPLYYYLLHLWVRLAGDGEYSVRLLSVIPGVLLVAVVYAWGRRAFGMAVGLLAAALVAASPFLLVYSRLPRMYALLALLGALAAYSYLRLSDGGGRRWWFALGAALLAAAYTHYYAAMLYAVFSPLLLLHLRAKGEPRTPWLVLHAVTAALYLPWLLYAVRGSAEATAGIIRNYPTPPHVAALVEQLLLVLIGGELLQIDQARLLAAGVLATGGLAAALGRRRWNDCGRGWSLLLAYLGIPLSLGAAAYLVYPPFVRPRFFIFLTPAALLLLAALAHSPRAAWLRAGASLLLLGALGAALPRTLYAESHVLEVDSVETAQFLAERAYPDDGLLFHAFWQLGYLRSHWNGTPPAGYALRDTDITDLPGLLSRHRRLWLVMFRAELRDQTYPQEAWLDQHAHLAFTWWNHDTRLKLYLAPDETRPLVASGDNFGNEIELASYSLSTRQLEAGDALAVALHWRALAPPSQRYTVFLHLLDAAGEYVTGEDGEPLGGLRPTVTWQAGDKVTDRRALYLPRTVPPGRYLVEAGLYETASGERLPVVNRDAPEDRVVLGEVEVTPMAASHVRPRHVLKGPPPGLVALAGYDLSSDLWQQEREEPFRSPRGPSALSFGVWSRGGDTLSATLYWRQGLPKPATVGLRLRDTGPLPASAEEATHAASAKSPADGRLVAEELTVRLPEHEEARRYHVVLEYDAGEGATAPGILCLAEVEVAPPAKAGSTSSN